VKKDALENSGVVSGERERRGGRSGQTGRFRWSGLRRWRFGGVELGGEGDGVSGCKERKKAIR